VKVASGQQATFASLEGGSSCPKDDPASPEAQNTRRQGPVLCPTRWGQRVPGSSIPLRLIHWWPVA